MERLKILLLQARTDDDPAKAEEVRSFARGAGVAVEQLECHNLLHGPPSLDTVRRCDALMIGGSGEYYVSKGHLPHQEASFDLLREIVETGHPTFASCFGFQCMVEALGGEIVHDPQGMEIGTYDLRLTDAGRSDELFSALPDDFPAQMGRKDRAVRLPGDWPNLAASDLCPMQGLRVPGKPIWGSQFHPELDSATNLSRFERYIDGYAETLSPDEVEEARGRYQDSPHTDVLLKRFLALVFG